MTDRISSYSSYGGATGFGVYSDPYLSGCEGAGGATTETKPKGPDTCGSPSNGTEFVPDQPLGYDFSGSCAAHDACYATPDADREECDTEFGNDLQQACETESGGGVCSVLGVVYYQFVDWFGQGSFDEAQKSK